MAASFMERNETGNGTAYGIGLEAVQTEADASHLRTSSDFLHTERLTAAFLTSFNL